jgi:hypothetical protein
MNSREWDARGWGKQTNPSGEVIRTKEYKRIVIAWDSATPRELIKHRYALAELLQIHAEDLLCDLEVTVKCNRYPKHQRLNYYAAKVGK